MRVENKRGECVGGKKNTYSEITKDHPSQEKARKETKQSQMVNKLVTWLIPYTHVCLAVKKKRKTDEAANFSKFAESN